MAVQKPQLKKSYFKRFQTKFRRRREGKTDYKARRILLYQPKNKYNQLKYRLVVRILNKRVICQVAYAKIIGDFTIAQAQSCELQKYGIKVGLTNYAAAYATGLLCARRLLSLQKMSDVYQGFTDSYNKVEVVEPVDEGPLPFKAILDVGLARTSTGAKVFAAMKGFSDGGVYIPHNERRFPGYDKESKKLDGEVLRKYILGGHVSDYMQMLKDEDPEKYNKLFSVYIRNNIEPESLEDMYLQAHQKIRENPFIGQKSKQEKETKKQINKKNRVSRKERKERAAEKKRRIAENRNLDVDFVMSIQ